MNDKELMDKVFDKKTVDSLSAEELLSRPRSGARVRTGYIAPIAAALVLAAGVGAFLLYSRSVKTDEGTASPIEASQTETKKNVPDDVAVMPEVKPGDAESMPDPAEKPGWIRLSAQEAEQEPNRITFYERGRNPSVSYALTGEDYQTLCDWYGRHKTDTWNYPYGMAPPSVSELTEKEDCVRIDCKTPDGAAFTLLRITTVEPTRDYVPAPGFYCWFDNSDFYGFYGDELYPEDNKLLMDIIGTPENPGKLTVDTEERIYTDKSKTIDFTLINTGAEDIGIDTGAYPDVLEKKVGDSWQKVEKTDNKNGWTAAITAGAELKRCIVPKDWGGLSAGDYRLTMTFTNTAADSKDKTFTNTFEFAVKEDSKVGKYLTAEARWYGDSITVTVTNDSEDTVWYGPHENYCYFEWRESEQWHELHLREDVAFTEELVSISPHSKATMVLDPTVWQWPDIADPTNSRLTVKIDIPDNGYSRGIEADLIIE